MNDLRVIETVRSCERWLNTNRLLQIPLINWGMLIFYVAFLIRLTLRYNELYMRRALTTLVVSNTLLYGLADTLAQTIPSVIQYRRSQQSVRLDESSRVELGMRSSGGTNKVMSNRGNGLKRQNSGYDTVSDIDEDDASMLKRLIEEARNSNEFSDMYEGGVPEEPLGLTPAEIIALPNELVGRQTFFDARRLIWFMVWGFGYSFVQYPWYLILNSLYDEKNVFLHTLQRVLTDQLVYSPVNLLVFFTYTTFVIEGGGSADVKAKIRRVYLRTLATNYCVWPLAQFINFIFIPVQGQVPFASTIGVFWNAFLSMKVASFSA
ncbi:hypothetical protein NADFUDRAFT_81065 [Nadsonia fulvescens var. elongata DSM 6958]|uniref:Uncharacterized protein n=1 Tax=Nadsonia fulvescens var. elongata DSM 6958 TaxID=857566 RepID=A0A1E3PRK7_9ASCO|nr:hypothetical protein NADFUDRAFT_81065 [Nadsonia fulvescens var. elongata DSM 6958]